MVCHSKLRTVIYSKHGKFVHNDLLYLSIPVRGTVRWLPGGDIMLVGHPLRVALVVVPSQVLGTIHSDVGFLH